ncbi:protein of unknown function [Methylotuvimicrobium alcaliphilum 20Z]|uniref:Uncharacterized protein n=1 Tax=Methylotuvimicrobium alcaliphilum (strain DSM 19304 / NCIMB 14124 / VKM B-2133 / 20Z) TaxID=1091494 RepID=G4T1C7_META2|nr:protein of unknown function [Methylotuvimicrobium alcaliphilum 20Z]
MLRTLSQFSLTYGTLPWASGCLLTRAIRAPPQALPKLEVRKVFPIAYKVERSLIRKGLKAN